MMEEQYKKVTAIITRLAAENPHITKEQIAKAKSMYNGDTRPIEEIESEPTSQGYQTYIFKWDDIDEYDVYIDLNGATIVEDGGYEESYKYFTGSFKTLDEAKIFIETFKLNEEVIK